MSFLLELVEWLLDSVGTAYWVKGSTVLKGRNHVKLIKDNPSLFGITDFEGPPKELYDLAFKEGWLRVHFNDRVVAFELGANLTKYSLRCCQDFLMDKIPSPDSKLVVIGDAVGSSRTSYALRGDKFLATSISSIRAFKTRRTF